MFPKTAGFNERGENNTLTGHYWAFSAAGRCMCLHKAQRGNEGTWHSGSLLSFYYLVNNSGARRHRVDTSGFGSTHDTCWVSWDLVTIMNVENYWKWSFRCCLNYKTIIVSKQDIQWQLSILSLWYFDTSQCVSASESCQRAEIKNKRDTSFVSNSWQLSSMTSWIHPVMEMYF